MNAEARLPNPSVLVIGEALVDIVVREDDVETEGHAPTDGAALGEGGAPNAAPVVHPGGSPLNVAYGLARLGVPTLFTAHVGDDDYGRSIIRHLDSAGVVFQPANADAAPTSTATARLDSEGRASYEFDIEWKLDPVDVPASVRVLHTGSIASVLLPGAAEIRRLFAAVRRNGSVLLSYDPNVRPSITPDRAAVRAEVEALAAAAHIVKLSDEDAEWLYPGVELESVVSRYLDAGSVLVGVTRGGDGCLLAARGIRVSLPARPVDVVDTIGAGDSFMSGLLYAVLQGGLVDGILGAAAASTADGGDGTASGAVEGNGVTDAQVRVVARTALESARVTVSRAGANPPSLEELAGA